MGDFAKEQEKFATEKKEQGKRSKTAVPPWVGYNEEETMKKQILALSTDKRNFVRNPPAGVQFQFDFDATFPVAMATSQEDPNLRKMRFELVPKQVKEDVFWRNYFYRVSLIKQPNQLTTLAQEGSSLGSRSDDNQEKELETDRTIMWSRLPGIPSKMKWPVLVYHDSLHKNMIDVFCKADDAVFTVKMVNLEPFLRSLRSSWEQIGMKYLSKKKNMLASFIDDLKWAKDQTQNPTLPDDSHKVKEPSDAENNYKQKTVELSLDSYDSHKVNEPSDEGEQAAENNYKQKTVELSLDSYDSHKVNEPSDEGEQAAENNYKQKTVELSLDSYDSHKVNEPSDEGEQAAENNYKQKTVELSLDSYDSHKVNKPSDEVEQAAENNYKQKTVELSLDSCDSHKVNEPSDEGEQAAENNYKQKTVELSLDSYDSHKVNEPSDDVEQAAENNYKQKTVELSLDSYDSHKVNEPSDDVEQAAENNYKQKTVELSLDSYDSHKVNEPSDEGEQAAENNYKQKTVELSLDSYDSHKVNEPSDEGEQAAENNYKQKTVELSLDSYDSHKVNEPSDEGEQAAENNYKQKTVELSLDSYDSHKVNEPSDEVELSVLFNSEDQHADNDGNASDFSDIFPLMSNLPELGKSDLLKVYQVEELIEPKNVAFQDEETSTVKSLKRTNDSDGKSFHKNKKQMSNFPELGNPDLLKLYQVEELIEPKNVAFQDDETSTVKSVKRTNDSDGKSFHKNKKQRINSDSDDGIDNKQVLDKFESDFVMKDSNMKGIYIKRYRLKRPRTKAGQSRDIRIYDNTHACYFCGKIVLHINEHLKTHRNQDEVKFEPDFTALRKLGDDRHNRQCLKKGEGEIILARRPKDYFDITQYGPCPDCREWVLLKGLKCHNIECNKYLNLKTKKRKKDLIIKSQILAGHIKTKPTIIMQKEVLSIMTRDEVSDIAQKDPLIMALGESWLKMNVGNKEKRKYYASARMRLCARFLNHLRSIQKSKINDKDASEGEHSHEGEDKSEEDYIENIKQKPLWDFLKPQHFGDIVVAAIKCSYPNADDNEDLLSPSNAIKLKYDINRLICSKWGFIVEKSGNGNSKEALECETILNQITRQWKEKVTTTARNVLNLRKYQEKKELPSPEDIRDITEFLVKELKELPLTSDNFHRVVSLAQARLLLYNKRRSGELEVIKLQSFASRSQGLQDIDDSLSKDFTEVEKYLVEKQDLMTVRGKRGRPVPVIIPPDCRRALSFLANNEQRKLAKIVQGNPYLFPNSVNYYARAYDSVKKICNELQLVSPHRITSVSMRKYMATLTQMLNLDKYQLDWVCNHLGHTRSVHKEHYRQMSGLLERTQISKLLLIQDLNLTSKFKGKKLEDMDIKDVVFPNDDDCNDEDETDVISENLSIPEETVDIEENLFAEEAEKEDKEDEEEEMEEEGEVQIAKKVTRKRWTDAEVKELKRYFNEFLQSGTTPRSAFIDEMRKKSKKNHGCIHLRENHLIIKKISNMNHAKR
ncbi:uncharacterized protein [Mytilus edulis]|uniref:uncharacterized protein isoform X1 n=2 Tax=Mytilus edulis TaxID=6550 RepID=UPI0039F0F61D